MTCYIFSFVKISWELFSYTSNME